MNNLLHIRTKELPQKQNLFHSTNSYSYKITGCDPKVSMNFSPARPFCLLPRKFIRANLISMRIELLKNSMIQINKTASNAHFNKAEMDREINFSTTLTSFSNNF
ncbi:hypothetical protein BUQ74_01930 [Leptospira weilii serovar Heyan]|nr:hypothetical protein BUQ74_01930 [Leptospira weilii serovar Heyan]